MKNFNSRAFGFNFTNRSASLAAREAERLVKLNPNARELKFFNEVDDALYVLADHQRLVQVFVNLYTNAVDASEPGGYIQTTAKATRDKVQIRITDTGHGIHSSIRDKIMEPFFTTKTPGEGTGLGLALADNIVNDYNGSVRLQARRGRRAGTEAIVQLPRATAPMEARVNG